MNDICLLSETDVKTVKLDDLADIKDIHINPHLSQMERFKEFFQQIKNPYCFRCGNITVKIGFADTDISLENCLEGYFRTL